MITRESIMEIGDGALLEAAGTLSKDDIAQLVDWLSLKADDVRYRSLLLLQNRSSLSADVYPYLDTFWDKLRSDNSYQRNIGLILIAENARWDTQNRLNEVLDDCFSLLLDEKPITIRYCAQSLGKIAQYKKELGGRIASRLAAFDITAVRETMRKPILLDILDALLIIREHQKTDAAEQFILDALSGGLLDNKTKKRFEAALK